MEHILKIEGHGLQLLHQTVFPQISTGETILFLGAGASITEKNKFLSREIMNLYSAAKGISLDTEDIIEFVDTLSASEDFNRRDFDDFVGELLRKLKVTETHKIIASTRWKEIITTNFDTLLEKAFDEVIGTPDENLKLVPVRSAADHRYNQANDEVKYVKLNGCISDKRRFPFVFSTRDFAASNVFYKTALRALENLSPKITFISVGFSYSDIFAKTLLQKFDKFNYRNRRWMLNVDPYVQDARLDFLVVSHNLCCQAFEWLT